MKIKFECTWQIGGRTITRAVEISEIEQGHDLDVNLPSTSQLLYAISHPKPEDEPFDFAEKADDGS